MRVVDVVGEGAEGLRLPEVNERLDVIAVLEVPRGQQPRLVLILAEVALQLPGLAAPTEGEGVVELPGTRILQQVASRAAVAPLVIGDLCTPGQLRVARESALQLQEAGVAASISGEAPRQRALQRPPTIGQGLLPEYDDPSDGLGAVGYGLGALEDVHLIVGIHAHLGGVVLPPLLA